MGKYTVHCPIRFKVTLLNESKEEEVLDVLHLGEEYIAVSSCSVRRG